MITTKLIKRRRFKMSSLLEIVATAFTGPVNFTPLLMFDESECPEDLL